MDGVFQGRDGLYEAMVKIQDGTETVGKIATEREAREQWALTHKHCNNNDVKPEDAPLFVWSAYARPSEGWVEQHRAKAPTVADLPERLTGNAIIAWSAMREPPADPLWRDAYHRQLSFVLHDLPRAWRSAPAVEVHDTLLVVGVHASKGVALPVYQFDLPTRGIVVMLRGDFHRWRVSVAATRPVRVAPAGLFDPRAVTPPWHCSGVPAGWCFGCYFDDPRRFTVSVATDLQVYTLLHLIARRSAEGALAGAAEADVALEPDEEAF